MKFDPQFPLVLDVDGTLIRNDLTHDLLTQSLRQTPLKILQYFKMGLSDKAQMKGLLVESASNTVDATALPYNEAIVDIAVAHHAQGGQVILCSGSHQSLIDKIAHQFTWVSEAFGTVDGLNLTGDRKAEFLSNNHPNGFHYIGNSTQDYPVWRVAKTGLAVNPPSSVDTVKAANGDSIEIMKSEPFRLKTFLKCIRIHQWAKNGLVGLIPLLTLAELTADGVFNVVLGFLAMSLLASATYIFNDLIDIPDDRQHPSKRRRPLANGDISVPTGLLVMFLLGFASLACLAILPPPFSLVLLAYFVLTISYSCYLKRIPILDVIMLASLFAIRVIAGATLTEQSVSPWLLNYVASFFLSLALVKRYTEVRKKENNASLLGRGYIKEDEPLLLSLGIMATGLAILSFLLYSVLAEDPVIHSQGVRFVLLTILTYWLMRIWFLAHRKTLNDDPVLFALKDGISLVLGLFVASIVIIAQLS